MPELEEVFALTPRVAASVVSAARLSHTAFPPDPDRTLLTAPAALDALRDLLGPPHWDAVLETFAGRERPSPRHLLKVILGRANGDPPTSALINLDTLHREPTTGRPRSVPALADDLLGIAPPWHVRDDQGYEYE